MFSQFSKIAWLLILIAFFVLLNFFGFAKALSNPSVAETLDLKICESEAEIEKVCAEISLIECRQFLEKCEQYFEEKATQIEKEIAKTKEEKKTLSNKINTLKKEIESLNYKIYQNNLAIKDLTLQIDDTQNSIDKTSLKVGDSENQLKKILREIYEKEESSVLEMFLKEEKFSDFFGEIFYLETLSLKMQTLLGNIKELKTYLDGQKEIMDEEKESLENLVIIQNIQKKESEETKKEKEYFLKMTEAEYQKYLKEKETTQKKVAEIRGRIFELIGVPEAPTFGEAYEIAKYVEKITGVKPALLLAVLTQESNIGKNVGQCFLKNPSTGGGIRVLTGKEVARVMNPSRDIPYFLEITKELSRDPFNTPVSCPMSVGWGGAMGPAQFIPDTWANPNYGYGQKVKEVTGKTADPWRISDAFLAAGLYLRDLGAAQNEFKAVMRYFSGSSWAKWEEFYGKSVLSIKAQYEKDIKEIEGSQ